MDTINYNKTFTLTWNQLKDLGFNIVSGVDGYRIFSPVTVSWVDTTKTFHTEVQAIDYLAQAVSAANAKAA
jgi:hypothetical protein